MATQKIKRVNTFHNTEIKVLAHETQNAKGETYKNIFYVTKRQVRRIKETLCGCSSCACGITRGGRFDLYELYDGGGEIR